MQSPIGSDQANVSLGAKREELRGHEELRGQVLFREITKLR